MTITPNQMKAARALLGIKQRDLAQMAGISIATLNNIERGAQTDPKISTMQCIQRALENAGIVFHHDVFDGVGVSLKLAPSTPNNASILIVDDCTSDRKLYKTWLTTAEQKRYHVYEAENARAGFEAFVNRRPQCIVLDFMMYGADGFQLLAALKRDHAVLPPIIFVSAMHSDVLAQSAATHGVFCCLNKSKLTQHVFCSTVKEALSH